MSVHEKVLIEKSKNGDIESFEKLIEKYQVVAFNIAYRMVGNKEDAKDIAQEALIKVYKSLKSFKGDSSFSTWLYKIVTNTCIDAIRKLKKVQTYSLDKEFETENGNFSFQIADNKYLPDRLYEVKEKKELVQTALNKIDEKYKSVLVLRDIQGFTYEEISKITQNPIGTIKSRINRGRLLLKEILIKESELFLEN
ncbi:RNA polymerase sigma factor [Paramaledivibacter caminithermalis]|uniref:RNA polymerase, sigma-24 subunit, RpoE n=1 Tax=Paramaledivibacter caminithermalis (strain DSM 15212 / CIP 107654 / DViRD3) TaxID=1121301 RepID=A0A1M6MDV7_PARC5|nr:sigma-70 family RNA polymerase sigma factor [Paramaledivibacter caminithermalis]SHJ81651.1 RNA polymerase, sigma-24 subunit, RpoE [Paramaledivibacter caminithermalis DSM 15212]